MYFHYEFVGLEISVGDVLAVERKVRDGDQVRRAAPTGTCPLCPPHIADWWVAPAWQARIAPLTCSDDEG